LSRRVISGLAQVTHLFGMMLRLLQFSSNEAKHKLAYQNRP
jgi:hypothetical protein